MIADVSPYVAAGLGLLGSLIGGTIAAVVTLLVARAVARGWPSAAGPRHPAM